MKASTVFTPIAILASASVSEASLGGAGRLAGSLAKSFGSNRANGLNIVTECGHPDAICPDKMKRAGAWRFLNRRQVDGVPDHEYERCGEDAVNSPIQVTGNGQSKFSNKPSTYSLFALRGADSSFPPLQPSRPPTFPLPA